MRRGKRRNSAGDVVGWTFDGALYCTQHKPIPGRDDDRPAAILDVQDEGWEYERCDECQERLGDVEGVVLDDDDFTLVPSGRIENPRKPRRRVRPKDDEEREFPEPLPTWTTPSWSTPRDYRRKSFLVQTLNTSTGTVFRAIVFDAKSSEARSMRELLNAQEHETEPTQTIAQATKEAKIWIDGGVEYVHVWRVRRRGSPDIEVMLDTNHAPNAAQEAKRLFGDDVNVTYVGERQRNKRANRSRR